MPDAEVDGYPSDLLQLEVPCNRDAPCVVRDAIDQLDEVAPVRHELRLLASELVTNAVLHSACGDGATIQVELKLKEDCLVIAVCDPSESGRTASIRVEEDPARGRFGLQIVQRLSRASGSERPDGQLVWAELAVG